MSQKNLSPVPKSPPKPGSPVRQSQEKAPAQPNSGVQKQVTNTNILSSQDVAPGKNSTDTGLVKHDDLKANHKADLQQSKQALQ